MDVRKPVDAIRALATSIAKLVGLLYAPPSANDPDEPDAVVAALQNVTDELPIGTLKMTQLKLALGGVATVADTELLQALCLALDRQSVSDALRTTQLDFQFFPMTQDVLQTMKETVVLCGQVQAIVLPGGVSADVAIALDEAATSSGPGQGVQRILVSGPVLRSVAGKGYVARRLERGTGIVSAGGGGSGPTSMALSTAAADVPQTASVGTETEQLTSTGARAPVVVFSRETSDEEAAAARAILRRHGISVDDVFLRNWRIRTYILRCRQHDFRSLSAEEVTNACTALKRHPETRSQVLANRDAPSRGSGEGAGARRPRYGRSDLRGEDEAEAAEGDVAGGGSRSLSIYEAKRTIAKAGLSLETVQTDRAAAYNFVHYVKRREREVDGTDGGEADKLEAAVKVLRSACVEDFASEAEGRARATKRNPITELARREIFRSRADAERFVKSRTQIPLHHVTSREYDQTIDDYVGSLLEDLSYANIGGQLKEAIAIIRRDRNAIPPTEGFGLSSSLKPPPMVPRMGLDDALQGLSLKGSVADALEWAKCVVERELRASVSLLLRMAPLDVAEEVEALGVSTQARREIELAMRVLREHHRQPDQLSTDVLQQYLSLRNRSSS